MRCSPKHSAAPRHHGIAKRPQTRKGVQRVNFEKPIMRRRSGLPDRLLPITTTGNTCGPWMGYQRNRNACRAQLITNAPLPYYLALLFSYSTLGNSTLGKLRRSSCRWLNDVRLICYVSAGSRASTAALPLPSMTCHPVHETFTDGARPQLHRRVNSPYFDLVGVTLRMARDGGGKWRREAYRCITTWIA